MIASFKRQLTHLAIKGPGITFNGFLAREYTHYSQHRSYQQQLGKRGDGQ